jgi:hypothetical protein
MNSAALLIMAPVAAILVALLIYCFSHPLPDQKKALAPERGDADDLQPGDSLDDFEDDGGFAYERVAWERAHRNISRQRHQAKSSQNWRNN